MARRIRWKARLAVYGTLASAVGGVLLWWLVRFGDAGEPGALDRGDNGLWMRRHWIHGPTPAPAAELGEALSGLGIRRIYPFLGPMDDEGWPGWRSRRGAVPYDPDRAAAFFAAMAESAPEVRVMPWTGGVLDGDVRLGDAAQRAAFAGHMRRITEMGAAGVHLNVEPLPSWEPGYLELLRAVKDAIGPDRVLSIAAYPPPTRLQPTPDVHWTLEFAREVCLAADELVVMAYDTAVEVPVVYETLVASWTADLASVLPPPEEGGCLWSIGVPAYEDDEPWHRPDVETIERGIDGVRRGLGGRPPPANFTGIAIYASWTVDEREWAAYARRWRGLDPPPEPPSFFGQERSVPPN